MKLTLVALLAVLGVSSIWSKNSTSNDNIQYNILPTKVECIDSDPVFCSDLVCDLKVVGRQEKKVYIGCNITQPVNDLMLHLVYYFKYGTIFRKYLVDYTLDICGFFGDKNKGSNGYKVLETFLSSFLKGNQTQLVHPCPFQGPHYIQNFTQVELLGQSMLPEGQYRVEHRLFSRKTNVTVIHIRYYYTVKSKNPLLDMRLG